MTLRHRKLRRGKWSHSMSHFAGLAAPIGKVPLRPRAVALISMGRPCKLGHAKVRLMSDEWNDTGLEVATLEPGKWRAPGTPRDSPMIQSVVDRRFKPLLEVAALLNLLFNELRHTACRLMALQGVPATIAMKRMGHSDIRLTLQRYTHVLEQQDKDAAARLDALMV